MTSRRHILELIMEDPDGRVVYRRRYRMMETLHLQESQFSPDVLKKMRVTTIRYRWLSEYSGFREQINTYVPETGIPIEKQLDWDAVNRSERLKHRNPR